MAIKTASINCRIREDVKVQAEAILAKIGLPTSVAIDMYYRQIIMNDGLPFLVSIPSKSTADQKQKEDTGVQEESFYQPSKDTIVAMIEAERIANDPLIKGFTDMDQLFADLRK